MKTKIKSIQSSETGVLSGTKVGLFIKCVRCNKGRNYLIDKTLKQIQNKMENSFAIEVECEGCGNIILVRLGYVEEQEGFSYKEPQIFGNRGLQVLDENGLGELE